MDTDPLTRYKESLVSSVGLCDLLPLAVLADQMQDARTISCMISKRGCIVSMYNKRLVKDFERWYSRVHNVPVWFYLHEKSVEEIDAVVDSFVTMSVLLAAHKTRTCSSRVQKEIPKPQQATEKQEGTMIGKVKKTKQRQKRSYQSFQTAKQVMQEAVSYTHLRAHET